MFFTFVLFVTPQSYFPVLHSFSLGKLSIGLALLVYMLDRLAHGRPLTVVTPAVRLVLCLVLLALLSIPFSRWPGGSAAVFVDEFSKSVIVFLLISNSVNTIQRMRLMIGSMALWAIIMSWVAVRDYSGGNLALGGLRIYGYDSPLAANPNDLALTVNLILPLVFGLYLGARKGLARLLFMAAIGLLASAVISSFSRGGFLTMMTVLLVVLINRLRERGPRVLGWVFGILLVSLVVLPAGYGDRVYSIFDAKADPTGSSDARWNSMVLAWGSMLAHPVIGVGLGMHGLNVFDQTGGWDWVGVHNVFLQIGADLGVLALVVYVLTIWKLLRRLDHSLNVVKEWPDAQGFLALGSGIRISIIGFVVGGFFSPVAYQFYLFYIAGLAVAFQNIAGRLAGERRRKSRQGPRVAQRIDAAREVVPA
jgi:O-antigen ligase